MPDVATATPATAAQTQAAGTRLLGYYLGSGGVKVDCLFDTTNFVTKDADGVFHIDGAGVGSGAVQALLELKSASDAANNAVEILLTPLVAGQTRSAIGATREGAGSGASVYVAAGNNIVGRFTSAGNFGVGIDPTVKCHIRSSVEIARFESTSPRGGGNGFIGFADPSGRKAFIGYGGLNDDFYVINQANRNLILGTNDQVWVTIDVTGNVTPAGDNIQVFGWSSARWSVIYAATGTINTSDAREKTWRGAPTSAELRAAKRIAAELGFYQWNDAVAEKGPDDARLHFGVRAQAVWAIMADEGLIDPIVENARPDSRYAFLCYDEWDAVEAVDEVRDEEGNVVAPAVPAQPGGNRFGVRPDQLALFLIAAQEARLAALEAAS